MFRLIVENKNFTKVFLYSRLSYAYQKYLLYKAFGSKCTLSLIDRHCVIDINI